MTRPAFRDGYRDLTVYRQEARAAAVDLSDNTNLFGSAPSAVESLTEWASRSPARYPTLVSEELREALGEWLGVDSGAIVGGCGSNDVLDAAMRAFGEPGATLAYPAPTFVMTPHFAAANSLVPVPVPTLADGTPDVDGLLATGARLIYLASPNNPSGRMTDAAALDRLLDRAPGVVILDEAYVEYAGPTRAREAVQRGNVLVTRTFSKAWGLAGLRLGYGVGAPEVVTEVEKARGPFKVNAVAEVAAAAAVRQDQVWLDSIVAATRTARAAVTARLRALAFTVFESDANFIAVRVADAKAAAAVLAEHGVGVRGFSAAPVMGDVLRVTIGPEAMMTPFLDAMTGASP